MNALKKGSRGEEVKQLLEKLNLIADGIFGPITEEAVIKFQKENGLKADGIVGDATWSKLNIGKSKRRIDEIIIHCSANKEGTNFTVNDIKRVHLLRGFSDIGYHYVIYLDGSIHKGRDINVIGAHCLGHNSNSIGICYIGGLDSKGNPKDTRTDSLKESLINLIKLIKKDYPKAKVYSHKDFAVKACPSFDATSEYKFI